jgi:alpha-maltose-1-phosphate synthase
LNVTFALLSPTFGMHQYTAHLADRAARELGRKPLVVTTSAAPIERYGREAKVVAAVACRTTGFAGEGLDRRAYRHALHALLDAARDGPVHFTGVHLWNVALVRGLRRNGVPVIHTLHDLAPHSDARCAALIRLWNRLLIASGVTLLVHGECYRRALLAQGVRDNRVLSAPLTHGFWRPASALAMEAASRAANGARRVGPLVLFFGRVERYKGADTLLEAWSLALQRGFSHGRLVLAGRVARGVSLPPLPPRAELRDRRINDAEALDLFREAALLALPYRDATQSALISAAAAFAVPSLVTQTGALAEYVIPSRTGWVVPPADPSALADTLTAALCDESCLVRFGRAAQEHRIAMLESELKTLAGLYAVAPSAAARASVTLATGSSGESARVQH